MLTFFFQRKRYYRFTRTVAGAIQRRLFEIFGLLAFFFVAHVLAMMLFEGLSLADAAWLTITTATTVGYGDIAAKSGFGRLATFLCLYMFGIFLLAQAASDLFDYRALSRNRLRRGEHRWTKMKNHLLIINAPSNDTNRYLDRLISHVRTTPSFGDIPVQILTDKFPDGLPTALVNNGVTHFTGVAENSENLGTSNAAFADYIIVIANESSNPRCDAYTFDILSRIKRICSDEDRTLPTIVAEAVEDSNRTRLIAAGATTVVRPVRAYPELIVRALAEPGTEKVLENLFTHDSDRLVRFDVSFEQLKWANVIVKLVSSGAGVPLAYVRDGEVDTNPNPDEICSGEGIIILLDETQQGEKSSIQSCLDQLQRSQPNT